MKKIAVGNLGEFWYGDYKEPFMQLEGAVPGYPQGVVLKDNDGKLLCAYCGKTWHNLGTHAARTHGLHAREYKQETGLLQKSALVSERLRMEKVGQAIRLRAVGAFRNPSLEHSRLGSSRGAIAGGRGGNGAAEAANKTGRCYAQLLAVGRAIVKERGHITQRDLRKRGIRPQAVDVYFGSWVGYIQRIGDTTIKRQGIRIRDDDLITALRSLAQELAHTPSRSDMRRYGLPSRRAYEEHFGSWVKACERAGLPPLPVGGVARSITDQEAVEILSAYALFGSIARVRAKLRTSNPRIEQVLARYGLVPLTFGNEPQRRQQMERAAELARSIAEWPTAA